MRPLDRAMRVEGPPATTPTTGRLVENIYLVTAAKIDLAELRQMVEALGGYWNDDPTLNQGVIEQRNARIFIGLAVNFRSEYPPEDLHRLRRELEV